MKERLWSWFNAIKIYLISASWLIFENLLRILYSLVIGSWIARYLGVLDFGKLSFSIAVFSIFLSFTNFGMGPIIVRDILESKDKLRLISTAIWTKTFLGILSIISLGSYFLYIDESKELFTLVVILALCLPLQGPSILQFYYEARVKGKLISLLRILQLLFNIVYFILIIRLKLGIYWFALGHLAANSLFPFLYFISFTFLEDKIPLKLFDKNYFKSLIADSFPIFLNSFLILLLTRIDLFFLQNKLGEEEVGLYSAAVKISESWHLFPAILINTLFPLMISNRNSLTAFNKIISRLFAVFFWASLLICSLVIILSKSIIILLFDTSFSKSIGVLQIHILSGINLGIGLVWNKWIILEKKQNIIIYPYAIGLLINLVLTWFMIDKYGLMGAAYSTIISYFLITISAILLHRPKYIFKRILEGIAWPIRVLWKKSNII